MPATILALVLFLCFATPGIFFELLRERSRPARRYTPFRETSIVIVASVCFTFLAAILLEILQFFVRRRFPAFGNAWFLDFEALAIKPADYSATHLPQVISLIVAVVIVAGLLALAVDLVFRWRYPPRGTLRNDPAWFDIIAGRARPASAKAILAAVELQNRGMVFGCLKGHEMKQDQTLAWLVLMKHSGVDFAIVKADGTVEEIPKESYMIIPGDQIKSVNVAYSASPK